MNYTAATYNNTSPAVFYGGGFCGGVDPRREQYAGEDVAGVEVPNYKAKYEALQNVIKDNYQLFEVDYYGIDNDNYVDGEGFCCESQANTRKGRSLPTENVDYEKLQYYYHSDHLGSASYITNLDGEVVQHIEYVPFGEVFLEERNNTWNTPFLFNGKELDEETGLYFYGARYYNPRISLWYGVDPLAEKYPAHSPYCYTMNNPVMLIDPDGREVDLSRMSKEERKRYETNLAIHREGSPLFDVMYSSLEESDKVVTIEFGQTIFVNGVQARAQSAHNEDGSSVITFLEGENLQAGALSEEAFHSWQNINKDNYTKGEFNKEFEAKTFALAVAHEAPTGIGPYEGMSDEYCNAIYFGDYGKNRQALTPSSIKSGSRFLKDYSENANKYADFNRKNNIGNDNYKKRTTTEPYLLQKVVEDAYGK